MVREAKNPVHVFAALFFATATAMLGIGIIAPILPLYVETFGASAFQIGLVFTAFSMSRAFLGPFVGRLSDVVGRKSLMLIGLAIYAGISVLYAIADSLWQLGVFRFLHGVGSVMVLPLAQAYVGDMTPKGKEGRYMNTFYASQFMGIGLGPLLGGTIGAVWSYQAAFLVMSGLSLLSLLLVSILVPVDRVTLTRKQKRRAPMVPLRQILRNDAVKALSVYVLTRGFRRQSFNTFFPLYAVAALAVGESQIGLVLSCAMFTEGLLQIPFGFLADRYSRIRQILIGSIFAPFLMTAIPFVSSIWGVLGIAVVISAFSALGRASLVAIRTEIGRTHGMATLGGLQSSSFAAGQMLGPLAGGVVADSLGLTAVFPFASSVGILGTGFVLVWMRRWLRRDPNARVLARLSTTPAESE